MKEDTLAELKALSRRREREHELERSILPDNEVVGELHRIIGPQTLPIHVGDLSPEVQALLKAALAWKNVFEHTEGDQYRLELAAENFTASIRRRNA